ncbi:hypothetical protein GG344DRAFT_82676 [Lentinula edodes]|nr:hypothetical protein GG344DRAFT_82676 [Lentinula edodes]
MFHIAQGDPHRYPHVIRQPRADEPTQLDHLRGRLANLKSKVTQRDVNNFLASVKTEFTSNPLTVNFFNIDLGSEESTLPVYAATISGRPHHFWKTKSMEAEIILDTGANNNYIRDDIATYIDAEYFALVKPREIVGARHTTTKGFVRFTIQIGTVKETILAYVLDKNSGFRYDLLLGRSFLAQHEVFFDWANNTFEMICPKTQQVVRVQAMQDLPQFLNIQEAYPSNISKGYAELPDEEYTYSSDIDVTSLSELYHHTDLDMADTDNTTGSYPDP